jgi:Rrf2 family protein
MKLTSKMRYGTRAALDVALHQQDGPVTVKDIAQRQEVSVKYIEHLLSLLQAAELVRAVRGRRGGYVLARPASQITLRQLYDVLEGPGVFVDCNSDPQVCHRSDTCVTQEVWARLAAACMQVLEAVTLESLARRAQERAATPDNYSI